MSTPPADLREGKAEGHYRLSCMKILELQYLMSFCVGECITSWEGTHPSSNEDRNSCAWDASVSQSMYLFIWLFICILYINILYNKLINVSKCFSEFCEPL